MLYGFALSYAFLPFAGITFTGADLVELVGSLPEAVKTSAKLIVAAPFAFHSWNGLRHLAWDSGKCSLPPFPARLACPIVYAHDISFTYHSPDNQGCLSDWLRCPRVIGSDNHWTSFRLREILNTTCLSNL